MDNIVILYQIDEYFKQAKVILSKQLSIDTANTALVVVESHQQKNKLAYLAVGHG